MLKADTQRTLINPIKSARDFVASWSSEHKANQRRGRRLLSQPLDVVISRPQMAPMDSMLCRP